MERTKFRAHMLVSSSSSSSFFFSRRLCGLSGSLTTRTPFRCVRFTEVDEYGEVCFWVRVPYLHLFLVKLEASMHGYAPDC